MVVVPLGAFSIDLQSVKMDDVGAPKDLLVNVSCPEEDKYGGLFSSIDDHKTVDISVASCLHERKGLVTTGEDA